MRYGRILCFCVLDGASFGLSSDRPIWRAQAECFQFTAFATWFAVFVGVTFAIFSATIRISVALLVIRTISKKERGAHQLNTHGAVAMCQLWMVCVTVFLSW